MSMTSLPTDHNRLAFCNVTVQNSVSSFHLLMIQNSAQLHYIMQGGYYVICPTARLLMTLNDLE